jgi:hypothetical protein
MELSNRSTTTRPCAGSATETVICRDDFSAGEFFQIEVENGLWQFFINGNFQHLIKIAVVKISEPVNAD